MSDMAILRQQPTIGTILSRALGDGE